MKILVSGSLAYDKIMDFPGKFSNHILPEKIHVLSVSFAVQDLKVNFGGTAGNIAYNLSLLGERPTVLAAAGNDFFPYKKWLLKNKVDLSNVKIVKNQPTACAHIITDQADNQITGFHIGAAAALVDTSKIKLSGVSLAIIAPGNQKDMVSLAKFYQRKKIPYIFDPGQQLAVLNKSDFIKCLTGAKVYISNDYELSLVLKKTGLAKEKLKSKIEILVTTLGEKGSIIEVGKKIYRIPSARPKNTCDPTGAGDAYRAGFIKGMLLGLPWSKVGRLASVVSAYTVEKYGTQTHKFTWQELQRRYKQNYKEAL